MSSPSCCSGSCTTSTTKSEANKTESFSQLIPANKNLSPEWIQSLYKRGRPEVHSGDDLQYIGMPVSGICTGQVYLGGDGRLWHWDVFKAYGGSGELIDPRGYHYADPVTPKSPIDQGFALQIDNGQNKQIRRLDSSGFSNIQFEGRYPIGYVNYRDSDSPVTVDLQAFSPFIPMDEDSSGLPLTVMEYSICNQSDQVITVDIAGWLENKICRYDDEKGKGLRSNEVARVGDSLMMSAYAEATENSDPSELEGYGNMTLSLLDSGINSGNNDDSNSNDSNNNDSACVCLKDLAPDTHTEAAVFEQLEPVSDSQSASQPFGVKTIGAISRKLVLKPGQQQSVRFVVSWYFPKYSGGYVFHSTMEDIPDLEKLQRYYAKRFFSSKDVASYLASNYSELSAQTRLWVENWYDSTLPYWLLNRTFLNASTLATQTCHRFDNGRFYAWEGVDCCPGTCQHVWHYAQAVARLFPHLERSVREDIDYGIAFAKDGSIGYRAEASDHGEDVNMTSENDADAFFAADGQLGTIIRVYREHSMSADSEFLQRLWPRVKKSLQFMMTLDPQSSGLLDAPQFNTLDVTWHGKIPWISSLYLAALSAGKAMAVEMADDDFALQCDQRLQEGCEQIVSELFNGEYFIHQPDENHQDSMDLTQGCYIDQVFGQGYAAQLGLERVIPKDQTVSALRALWKYNYAPDVGPYRENFKEVEGGRWYAMPGEGGLLMCTWPKEDCNRSEFEQTLLGLDVTSEGYLNECMTGFEYQVASHMIAEGLIEEGLAITRTIHDRYHPSKRNPWNEVECSDHYSRAMASYGVFINICGFSYHGPSGSIGFSPKLTTDNFRAPFTAAQGWGSFSQQLANDALHAQIQLKYGELALSQLSLHKSGEQVKTVHVTLNNNKLASRHSCKDDLVSVTLENSVKLAADDCLEIQIEYTQ